MGIGLFFLIIFPLSIRTSVSSSRPLLLFAPLISFIACAVLVFSARAGYGKVCSCGRERTHGRGGYPGFPAPLKAASYIGRRVTIIDATATATTLEEPTKNKR